MSPVLSAAVNTASEPGSQLNRLVVASLTMRETDTAEREALADELVRHPALFAEQVLLHTCHRVELIAFEQPAADVANLPGAMRRTRGLAAAERVFMVAGGLDSAVLAEEQVLGQVRQAYQLALSSGHTGPATNELLRRAIRFGKRVRSFAQPTGDRSLADRAVRWVEERLVELPTARPPRVLVIGTGEMGRALATHFAAVGSFVTIASRSATRAADQVADLPHRHRHAAVLTIEAMAGPLTHDVVAIALRGGATHVEKRHLNGPVQLVVDLSSPSCVSGEAATVLGDRLLNLDRLGVPDEARILSPDAERRLRADAHTEAQAFADWLAVRGSGDGIAMLHAHGEEVRRRHLARLRAKGSLNDEQAAAVEAMTAAMFADLLHGPTARLRQDPDAATRVREVFGIE